MGKALKARKCTLTISSAHHSLISTSSAFASTPQTGLGNEQKKSATNRAELIEVNVDCILMLERCFDCGAHLNGVWLRARHVQC